MARYSDKEKEKDKQAQEGYGQAPDTGYGEPPPPDEYGAPPPPPPQPPTGSLKVKIRASGSARKGMKLPGIDVTLRATAYGKVYEDTRTTGPDGEALWPDLPLDSYALSVEAPPEYEQPNDRKIELTQSHPDAEEEIDLVLKDAVAYLTAFLDEKRCGDPAGQECLEIDLDVWTEGRFLKSVRTNRHRPVPVPVPPGEVVFKAQEHRTLRGKKWKAKDFQIFLEPGDEDTVNVPYIESLATLQLSAVFVDERHGGREIPMSGVQVLIYSGHVPAGKPFRQPVLADRAPKTEGSIDEGFYTLVPIGPESFRGAPVEPEALNPVFVEGGETTEVIFRFRQARGRLTGFLLEQKSQEGFEGARVRLYPIDGGSWLSAETGEHGEFTFEDVPAGLHELVLEKDKLAKPDGTEWVLAADSPRSRKVMVKAQATEIVVPPLQLVQDDHVLVIRVVGADAKPVSGVQVDVRDEQGNYIGTYPVDNDQGEVTVHVPRIGNYSVSLATFDSGALRPAAKQVFVNHPALITLEMAKASWSYPPGGGGPPREAVLDIPYPVLGAGFPVPSTPAGGSSAATTNLGASVENTLREVLGGWKPRGLKTDPKGFLGALNQAFTLKDIDGHVEFSWTPRTYSVQPDMGGLTGAQASIFNRAKVALDQSIPLLDGLYPLRADSDDQDVDAVRAVVRSTFSELVNELGVEGGPRVPRVDSLFEQLLGSLPIFDPEKVGGQLGMVAQQFGLQRRRINTIDEEQNLTNFIIVVEYVLSLKQSWDTQRGFFTRTGVTEPYFGTQLVLVSRALSVVAASVQEVYAAMDSVFVGPAERQVVELTFPNEAGQPSLFVAELLSWIEEIATEEGPRLIQEGGKAGVVAFQPTLDRVARMAAQALIPSQQASQLPAGYQTARVQRSLKELADYLDEAAQKARQIRIDRTAA